MALLAILNKEAFSKLPEGVREHYVEKKDGDLAGSFVLDVTSTEMLVGADKKKVVYALEDINGLKGTLQKLRDDNSALATKQKELEGIDPKKAKDAIARLEKLGDNPTKQEEAKAALDNLKAQLEAKFQGELSTAKQREEGLDKQIRTLLVDKEAAHVLDKYELVETGKKLLLPHLKSQVRVHKDEEGNYALRVVDPQTGQDRVSLRAGDNGYMGLDELVESYSKDKDYAMVFAGEEASGSAGVPAAGKGQPPAGRGQQRGAQQPSGQQQQQPEGRGIQSRQLNPIANLQDVRSRNGSGTKA